MLADTTIDPSDVYVGAVLLATTATPYMDFIGTIGQVFAWILGMVFLYWNIRKKRAEAKRAEKQIEDGNNDTNTGKEA